MISDVERHQGAVLRQILVGAQRPLTFEVVDEGGRVDCFRVGDGALQIKYSNKRLSPWQFSFAQEQFDEFVGLSSKYALSWLVLMCGMDGFVAIRSDDVYRICKPTNEGPAWIRVSRNRNSMYRVSGNIAALSRATPRGPSQILSDLLPGFHMPSETTDAT